ncbi:hypothetical protein PR048_028052 [Dryococelus australis]|uniref:Uncharacterized protein n=1 Tax=Dryococelus australis TaxID=614101 RepID=A0ABQ9GI94_9NEOP|nr:hypothetical protein PR048_028052 [Dryococelus australis]
MREAIVPACESIAMETVATVSRSVLKRCRRCLPADGHFEHLQLIIIRTVTKGTSWYPGHRRVYQTRNSNTEPTLQYVSYQRNAPRTTKNVDSTNLSTFQSKQNKLLANSTPPPPRARRGPIKLHYDNTHTWWGEKCGLGHEDQRGRSGRLDSRRRGRGSRRQHVQVTIPDPIIRLEHRNQDDRTRESNLGHAKFKSVPTTWLADKYETRGPSTHARINTITGHRNLYHDSTRARGSAFTHEWRLCSFLDGVHGRIQASRADKTPSTNKRIIGALMHAQCISRSKLRIGPQPSRDTARQRALGPCTLVSPDSTYWRHKQAYCVSFQPMHPSHSTNDICIIVKRKTTSEAVEQHLILAALSNEILRADEGEMTRECSGAGMQGRGKREITEKTCRPAASSGTISTCENPGVTQWGIKPGEQSNCSATATPWIERGTPITCCVPTEHSYRLLTGAREVINTRWLPSLPPRGQSPRTPAPDGGGGSVTTSGVRQASTTGRVRAAGVRDLERGCWWERSTGEGVLSIPITGQTPRRAALRDQGAKHTLQTKVCTPTPPGVVEMKEKKQRRAGADAGFQPRSQSDVRRTIFMVLCNYFFPRAVRGRALSCCKMEPIANNPHRFALRVEDDSLELRTGMGGTSPRVKGKMRNRHLKHERERRKDVVDTS